MDTVTSTKPQNTVISHKCFLIKNFHRFTFYMQIIKAIAIMYIYGSWCISMLCGRNLFFTDFLDK